MRKFFFILQIIFKVNYTYKLKLVLNILRDIHLLKTNKLVQLGFLIWATRSYFSYVIQS